MIKITKTEASKLSDSLLADAVAFRDMIAAWPPGRLRVAEADVRVLARLCKRAEQLRMHSFRKLPKRPRR